MAKKRLNRYLVKQPYIADRLQDETRQAYIAQKWTFFRKSPHLHNNLATYCLQFSTCKHCFELGDRMSFLYTNSPSNASIISSSLAVYRLMCIFGSPPIMPKRSELYKTLWEYPLKHRSTGICLTLLDYKAGFTINTKFSDTKQMSSEFASDLLDLLNFLVSEQVAHPYDGTVAGTVA
jgi:hypothetical protein